MNGFLEGLRGPILGVIMAIFILAGTIIVAAFAALVAQMSLLLRLRPRENAQQTPMSYSDQPAQARQPVRSNGYRSPRIAVVERSNEDVIDAVWWQEHDNQRC
jgi:hypothetical protein